MNDDRGSWYLLTSILLGLGLGLLYSWVISPAKFIDTHPITLREDYKDQYRAMISLAFSATGNLERAKRRLELFSDEDSSLALVIQAQRYLADGDHAVEAQALAKLASALGQVPTPHPTDPEITATSFPSKTPTLTETLSPPPTSTSTPTPSLTSAITLTLQISATQNETTGPTRTPIHSKTPQATVVPTETTTPTPTRTPTATLAPPFVLDNRIDVCNPAIGESQLQVFVSNAAGVGIPGVEIIVTWNVNEEHIFTGLKSDIDTGYADFVMTPEVIYTLQVADGGQLIPSLIAPPCEGEDGDPYWGSLRLVFSHP